MTVSRRLSIATMGFRGGDDAGTTILVDDLGVSLSSAEMSAALTEDVSVELSSTSLAVTLSEQNFEATIEGGFSVTLDDGYEVTLG